MQPGKADLPLHRQARESDPEERTHLLTWHSLTLTAETEKAVGEQHLLALVWAGLNEREREPWEVVSSSKAKLKQCHPTLGEWRFPMRNYRRCPSWGGGR